MPSRRQREKRIVFLHTGSEALSHTFPHPYPKGLVGGSWKPLMNDNLSPKLLVSDASYGVKTIFP